METCARPPGRLLAAGLAVFLVLALPGAAAADTGATSCACKDCHITITLKVAFFGAGNDYINRFVAEVQNTWNGPQGNPSTYGDCRCPFEVKVVTKPVTNCTAETEYHCIQVTNYTANPPYSGNESVLAQARNGTIDPRTSPLVTRHRGYLYPPGTSTGSPLAGWWSDAMSTPYNGSTITDFAHEAGHLMGLDDGSGGIMDFAGMTSGRVSQANIDQAVDRACKGQNPCPDRCCCGNGVVDRGKGEQCDPVAAPSGCGTGSSCCPVCCQCRAPSCDPAAGEYASGDECRKNCLDKNNACHINYYTGCWDCVPRFFIQISDAYNSSRETIWKADESLFHPPGTVPVTTTPAVPVTITLSPSPTVTLIRPAVTLAPEPSPTAPPPAFVSALHDEPVIMDFLKNERVNIHLPDGDYHITTQDGNITGSGDGTADDPTVSVYTDRQTLDEIGAGELPFDEAVSSGRVRFEGVGFVNGLKFAVSENLLKIRSMAGEFF